MNKKRIILTAAVGLLSFAAAFAIAWLTRPAPVETTEPAATQPQNGLQFAQQQTEMDLFVQSASQKSGQAAGSQSISEKQLKSLVFEVRERIRQYNNKLEELELREKRLQIAQDTIKQDIEELNSLKVELASTVAKLKEHRDQLLTTRASIAASERANLVSLAATYDKMDSGSASKIIANLCAEQMKTGILRGGSFDDATKILHYMTERTKAKLLAELVTSEPKLTAALSRRLKEIVEQE